MSLNYGSANYLTQAIAKADESMIEVEVARILSNLDALIREIPQRFVDHMQENHADELLLLVGPERVAYRVMRLACQKAQIAVVEAGLAKREALRAIEDLGRIIAPSVQSE